MVIVEHSEHEHIGDGPAISRVVPLRAPTSSTEATVSPEEIAKQIISLLNDQGIPQQPFCRKGAEQISRIIFPLFIKGPSGDA